MQPVAQQLSMISAKLDVIIAKSKNTTATPTTIPGVNEGLENDSVEVNDKWDVEVDEKVFTLKSDSLLISLDEESVEKILKALASRKTVSVKDTIKGTLFAISSQAGGNGAIVKKSGDETTFFIKKEAIDELKKTFMAAQNIKEDKDTELKLWYIELASGEIIKHGYDDRGEALDTLHRKNRKIERELGDDWSDEDQCDMVYGYFINDEFIEFMDSSSTRIHRSPRKK